MDDGRRVAHPLLAWRNRRDHTREVIKTELPADLAEILRALVTRHEAMKAEMMTTKEELASTQADLATVRAALARLATEALSREAAA